MANTAPAMIWVTGPDGSCTFLSRAWFEYTGQEEETALGFGWLDAVHPDDRPESHRIFLEANEEHQPFRFDYRLRYVDGSYRWAIDAGRPRFDSQGRFLGFTGSVTEIHERKEAEVALLRAQELLEGITEGTEDLIAAEDTCFRYTYFNRPYQREFTKLWGIDLTLGADMVQALAPWPEQQQRAKELWSRALSGESFRVETEFGPSPEESRSYDLRFSPIRDEGGEVIGAAHIFRDVTDRVRASENLRESEAKFRSVFEQAAIGMGRVRFDELRWIDVNDGLCRMLGYSRERILKTPWNEITHPDDVDLDLVPFRKMAEGELDSYTVEKRFIHAKGHTLWARLTLSLVRDARGRPDYELAIIEDVSDRKAPKTSCASPMTGWSTGIDERTSIWRCSATSFATLSR
ncbi:MAG: PAS domain S-box protein [Myxococcales bacterium]|nr:PAS domain S-box protein [Myxococcales bacterium]